MESEEQLWCSGKRFLPEFEQWEAPGLATKLISEGWRGYATIRLLSRGVSRTSGDKLEACG